MAFNLEQVDKFFQNVRGWPHAHGTRTLEGAALLPPTDAFFAEKLSTVVALDGVSRDFELVASSLHTARYLPRVSSANTAGAVKA